jgi:hypothetical protein
VLVEMGALVRVRLLGPVDVVADGQSRPVSGLRRKAVLATLALQAGEVVSIGRLAAAVWGDAAPATAVNAPVTMTRPGTKPSAGCLIITCTRRTARPC